MKNQIMGMVIALSFLILVASVTADETYGKETYGFVRAWGSQGSGNGQFAGHMFIALDAENNVYVTDDGNNRVQKFSNDGIFLKTWGFKGSSDGQFSKPFGIACDSAGNVYVVDSGNHRVEKFSTFGNQVLATWGSEGAGNGKFMEPVGIAIDTSDNVYVTDSETGLIQKFTSAGAFIKQWGGKGTGAGKFGSLLGIATDRTNNLYVTDYNNENMQEFTSAGDFLFMQGSHGTGNTQFISPFGIAVDDVGNIFVVNHGGLSGGSEPDPGSFRVQKFITPSGGYAVPATQWGSFGSGDGQFKSPEGIGVDAGGNVFVADAGNNRIQKFALVKPSLTITSTPPGAEIFLNSADTQHVTPYTFTDMTPGTSTLKLTYPGYEDIPYYSIILKPGRTTTVDLHLNSAVPTIPPTQATKMPLPVEIIFGSLVLSLICISKLRWRIH